MFQSNSHLPQLLDASSYRCPDFFAREQSDWFGDRHFVAVTDELPRSGCFVTRHVANCPLLVWRQGNAFRTFLNVCAHRYSTLTSKPSGQQDKMTCQYHGWEYGCDGQTRRIPDAASFRPLADHPLGLREFPTLRHGRILTAQIPLTQPTVKNDTAPAEDHAWGFYPEISAFISDRHRLVHASNTQHPVNWKVIVENAIESYHVSSVHSSSFGSMPDETTCRHELADDYSLFETSAASQAPAWLRFMERCVHHGLGIAHKELYRHVYSFPNILLSTSKMVTALMIVEPQTAVKTKFRLYVFVDPGPRRNPIAKALFHSVSRWGIRTIQQVLQEDFDLLPAVQQGINARLHPEGGLISKREERVYHFQQTLLKHLH